MIKRNFNTNKILQAVSIDFDEELFDRYLIISHAYCDKLFIVVNSMTKQVFDKYYNNIKGSPYDPKSNRYKGISIVINNKLDNGKILISTTDEQEKMITISEYTIIII